MIIRDHCLPGTPRNRAGWLPTRAWPEDCVVQWGERGLVVAGEQSRLTAFFEAFPTEPATFIRGEGRSVAAAEEAAFAKLELILACPGHSFERRGYRNGAGVCTHCGLFASDVFEPLANDPDQPSGALERAFADPSTGLAEIAAAYEQARQNEADR